MLPKYLKNHNKEPQTDRLENRSRLNHRNKNQYIFSKDYLKGKPLYIEHKLIRIPHGQYNFLAVWCWLNEIQGDLNQIEFLKWKNHYPLVDVMQLLEVLANQLQMGIIIHEQGIFPSPKPKIIGNFGNYYHLLLTDQFDIIEIQKHKYLIQASNYWKYPQLNLVSVNYSAHLKIISEDLEARQFHSEKKGLSRWLDWHTPNIGNHNQQISQQPQVVYPQIANDEISVISEHLSKCFDSTPDLKEGQIKHSKNIQIFNTKNTGICLVESLTSSHKSNNLPHQIKIDQQSSIVDNKQAILPLKGYKSSQNPLPIQNNIQRNDGQSIMAKYAAMRFNEFQSSQISEPNFQDLQRGEKVAENQNNHDSLSKYFSDIKIISFHQYEDSESDSFLK